MKNKIQAEIESVNQVQLSPMSTVFHRLDEDDFRGLEGEFSIYRDFVANHPFPSLERIMSYRTPEQRTNILGQPLSNKIIDPHWEPALARGGGLRYELVQMLYELGYSVEEAFVLSKIS